MSSVLKLEQSVQVLQLGQARAEQDAAQAHRTIEVRDAAVCVCAVYAVSCDARDRLHVREDGAS